MRQRQARADFNRRQQSQDAARAKADPQTAVRGCEEARDVDGMKRFIRLPQAEHNDHERFGALEMVRPFLLGRE